MGYSTHFDGILKFKKELTASQLAHLKTYLGKDRRELGFADDSVYAGGLYGEYWYHIDLELTENFEGLQWDGSEKTYDLDGIVNWLTKQMRMKNSDFCLVGSLSAQGEEPDDRWELQMIDSVATRVNLPFAGDIIICPHCDGEILLDANTKIDEE